MSLSSTLFSRRRRSGVSPRAPELLDQPRELGCGDLSIVSLVGWYKDFMICGLYNHPPERLSVISSPLPWVKQQELTHLGVVDRWQLWNGAMLPTHGSFRKRMVKVKFSNFTLHSFVLYTGIPFLLIVSGQKLTSCNLKKEGWAYPWLAVTWKEEITIRESLRQAMSTTSTTFPDLYHVRWFWIWRNDNFWALFMPCP